MACRCGVTGLKVTAGARARRCANDRAGHCLLESPDPVGAVWGMRVRCVHGRISTGSRRLRDPAENTPSAGRLVAIAAVA
jgi:hypothetical protein